MKISSLLSAAVLISCRYVVAAWSQHGIFMTSRQLRYSLLTAKSPFNMPEYNVVEDDDDLAVIKDGKSILLDDFLPSPPLDVGGNNQSGRKTSNSPKQQYAAMKPGTVVQIQIGDVSLARKAWKKRRRSGSPLLVPCSVINVDRKSTLRWNLMYLLEKFGTPCHDGGTSQGGIRISAAELARRHRTHLKSSLRSHTSALGYASNSELLEGLFNKQIQETYGVKLVTVRDELCLQAAISRFRAQKRAGVAAILQLTEEEDAPADDILQHTGLVRVRRAKTTEDEDDGDASGALFRNPYQLQPLSAAVRVSQDDVDSGAVSEGSTHAAVVFDYDVAGDAGLPLLTLSLNPSRNQVRERLKIPERKYETIRNPAYVLKDLKVGDGPLEGTVVRLIKSGALVDCGVGRRVNSQATSEEEMIKVLGFLRFRDAVTTENVNLDTLEGPGTFDIDDDDELDDDEWDDILAFSSLIESEDAVDDDDEDEMENVGDLSELFRSESPSSDDDGEESEWEDDQSDLNMFQKRTSREMNAVASSDKDGEVGELVMSDEGEEEVEDITHLFEMGHDGTLTYRDPETGETIVIDLSEDEESEEDEDADDSTEERFVLPEHDTFKEIDEVNDKISDSPNSYGEDIEDIASLLEMKSDGSLTYRDPGTGETIVIDFTDDDESVEDEVEDGNDTDAPFVVNDQARFEKADVFLPSSSTAGEANLQRGGSSLPASTGPSRRTVISNPTLPSASLKVGTHTKRLQVGERLQVYVMSVSKQSSTLILTMNAAVHGMKARDIKKEKDVSKRLSRLSKQLGGLHRLKELVGTECDGVVKAVSQAGDWVYVQPGLSNIPVGVATLEDSNQIKLTEGDAVRVRVLGVDNDRGQLSMLVLGRIQ